MVIKRLGAWLHAGPRNKIKKGATASPGVQGLRPSQGGGQTWPCCPCCRVSGTGDREPHTGPPPGRGKQLGQAPGPGASPVGGAGRALEATRGRGPGLQHCSHRVLLRSLSGVSIFYWPLFQKRHLTAAYPRAPQEGAARGTRGRPAWPALKHGGWEQVRGRGGHTSTGGLTMETTGENSLPDHTKGEVNTVWGKLLCFYYTNLLHFGHLCSLSHKFHTKRMTVAN